MRPGRELGNVGANLIIKIHFLDQMKNKLLIMKTKLSDVEANNMLI